MKAASEKHRNWLTAITFAEAGEWETAREMMPASRPKNTISKLSKIFMGVAFAEEGLHEEALLIIDGRLPASRGVDDFLAAVGLSGIRVTYGILAFEGA